MTHYHATRPGDLPGLVTIQLISDQCTNCSARDLFQVAVESTTV